MKDHLIVKLIFLESMREKGKTYQNTSHCETFLQDVGVIVSYYISFTFQVVKNYYFVSANLLD